jgi:hypothetical protein
MAISFTITIMVPGNTCCKKPANQTSTKGMGIKASWDGKKGEFVLLWPARHVPVGVIE